MQTTARNQFVGVPALSAKPVVVRSQRKALVAKAGLIGNPTNLSLGGWVPEPEDDDDDDMDDLDAHGGGYADIGEDDDMSEQEDEHNELEALSPADLARRQQLLRDFTGRKDWDMRPHVHTAGTNWGDLMLKQVALLLDDPQFAGLGLRLYSFIVNPDRWFLDVSLEKLSDPFGSPNVEELNRFNSSLRIRMDLELGQLARKVSLTVTSPGANRPLKLPDDLHRFGRVPLAISYRPSGSPEHVVKALQLEEFDEATSITKWRLADVKMNRKPKLPKLTGAQRKELYEIKLKSINQARLHVNV